MKNVRIVMLSALTLTLGLASLSLAAPKHDMETIMKKGMKGKESLLAKVTGGSGSKEDLALLQEYIHALAEHKPEKGDAASWKSKTSMLVKAVDAAAKGNRKALPVLKKAADCKACHKVHKPD